MYVLTCNRKTETYNEIFSQLLNIEPKINPTDITIDFEMAVINSVRTNFPQAEIHGCYFHFTQSVWRHVQSIGLQIPYTSDEDFAFQIRLLIALAFVPKENVVEAYDELIATEFYSEDNGSEYEPQIQALLTYFQSTYVFAIDRAGKRKNPLYPVELWNVYENTLAGKLIQFISYCFVFLNHPFFRNTANQQPVRRLA